MTLAMGLAAIPAPLAVGATVAPALTIPLPLGLPPIVIPIPGLPPTGGQGTSPGASPGSAPATIVSPPPAPPAPGNPFSGRAMWIWELSHSSRGSLAAIIAKAKRYGVASLIVKSSDGVTPWAQFTRAMISTFTAAGLHVCAWQYVYGRHPADEARLGAGAVREGATCLVIDAEGEYQGRYAAAQRYLSLLRAQIGAQFPVGLAGLPYVDYHPAFPYSVFLGPGGAQYSLPQMYWRDIGTTVAGVYAHTYLFNRLYERPIYPLGQLFEDPPQGQIIRFRQLSTAYGAEGVSWWDYQEATGSNWRGISRPAATLAGLQPDTAVATIGKGWKGDPVVWAQEHLDAAGDRVALSGDFGTQTQAAVEAFQAANGIPATGVIGATTWSALLKFQPVAVHWSAHSSRYGIARTARRSGTTPPPLSASLPGRDELRGDPGLGR